MRKADEGRRTLRCFAGVAPSAMFATTTVKLRMSPFVVSHAVTAGFSESARTSVLTSASLASSGGIVMGSPSPPSDGGGAFAEAVGAVAAVGTGRARLANAVQAATPAARSRDTPGNHKP